MSMVTGIIQATKLSLPHGASIPVAIDNRGAASLEVSMPYKSIEARRANAKRYRATHREKVDGWVRTYRDRKHREKYGNLKDMRGHGAGSVATRLQPGEGKGSDNPRWNGGRTVHARGYILVKVSAPHPRSHRGYVLEHILVAERTLGRTLALGECVHHINGVKSDNHPENLRVMSKSEHSKLHSAQTARNLWK